jgi:diguanylate cyclase
MVKILIVEDDEDLRESLSEMLKAEGFDAIAADGQNGIDLATREIPDLILCDIMMPEIDGYEVLDSVRQNPLLATIPFIFLTSKGTKEDFRQGMELGADDYLTKPFTRKELFAAVNTQLKKRSLRQEYYSDRIKQAEQQVNYLLHHDNLTQLPNRLLLREQFNLAIAQRITNGKHKQSLPILCICLDRLSKINKTLGYRTGNQLLKKAAERLTSCISNEDKIAYINDNNFIIILAGATTKQDAIVAANKILDRLCYILEVDRQEVFGSVSIGITLYPNSSIELEELVEQAYMAMDSAKQQGGNQYQFYTNNNKDRDYERLAIETCLHLALERGEFQVYYQPKVSLTTGKIVGAEALVRWLHPEKGFIPPSTFIPIAEETGLIVPLGEWVLKTACHQTQLWNARLLEPITIAVNLSGRQFVAPDLFASIDRIVRETKLDARYLELELTENILVQNPREASQTLKALKILGTKIAIDDFGTGYSSLSYLRQFPFDTLKIDRSFIHSLHNDTTNTAIVVAILQMARSLNLKVIAEGVETEAELACLCQHSCHEIQGYLFSRPLQSIEFAEIINSQKRLKIPQNVISR